MHEAEVRAKAREEFLAEAATHCTAIRTLFLAFANATDETRMFRLQALYRKVHFLTATAGLAECHHLAQMAAVFEAMLFQVMDQPSRITPSVLRTSAMAIDFLQMLFGRAAHSPGEAPLPQGRVLVVDDDPVCTRLVLWALKQTHLEARSAKDTKEAQQWLDTAQFDLVILDVGLPGMDGLEFCKLLRTFPAYKNVPIIHCTCHTDFQTRTQSALSGGDDFISKPVLPMELALKSVMHLIQRQAR
jgi:CheY-like chemotaxis protein